MERCGNQMQGMFHPQLSGTFGVTQMFYSVAAMVAMAARERFWKASI